MFAADGDRDRAAVALREHYARGRLTLDELTRRMEHVVEARSRAELRAALSGLPILPDRRELLAHGRSLARGAALVVFTGAYLVFSFALLAVLGVTALVHGASGSVLLAFLLVWLVPTYLLVRFWRRPPTGR